MLKKLTGLHTDGRGGDASNSRNDIFMRANPNEIFP